MKIDKYEDIFIDINKNYFSAEMSMVAFLRNMKCERNIKRVL